MKVFIYALQDPITQEIRYIGKTRNPEMRFHNHMNKRHNEKSHKRNWIESLKKQKLKPIMIIIEEVLEKDWKFWEKYWINQFIVWGFSLVNHTSGGDGLTMGNQTSFKKGHISWNKKTIESRICPQCSKEFKPLCNTSKRIYCSFNCAGKNRNISTQFKKNLIPWNKNNTVGYKLGGKKKSKVVLKIDPINNNIIEEFLGRKEAALIMGCSLDNIQRACTGKVKIAKGYKWKYKEDYKNE